MKSFKRVHIRELKSLVVFFSTIFLGITFCCLLTAFIFIPSVEVRASSEEILAVPLPTSSISASKVTYSAPTLSGSSEPEETTFYNQEDLSLVATTIYLETLYKADLQSLMTVGWVIQNRLDDVDRWGCNTYSEVIWMDNPTQFSVTLLDEFLPLKESILESDDPHAVLSVQAAKNIMDNVDLYKIPLDVQYFYGSETKRTWGTHTYYGTFGGNSFFYQ